MGNVISNTATRRALEPTVGRQIEAGVKLSFLDVRRRLSGKVDLDVRVNNLFDELYATTYYSNVEPQWFLGMPRSAEVAPLVGF